MTACLVLWAAAAFAAVRASGYASQKAASEVAVGSDGAVQRLVRSVRQRRLVESHKHVKDVAERSSEDERTGQLRSVADSAISERWGDQVVYAIFTSSVEKYHENLLAEMDTWAAQPHREGRFVAMGGASYPDAWKEEGVIMSTPCCDAVNCLACKEVHLLLAAAERKAKWVVLLGEDNWVNTEGLERALAAYNTSTPMAVGVVGCGKGLRQYCRPVVEEGGFCGGCGYAPRRRRLRGARERVYSGAVAQRRHHQLRFAQEEHPDEPLVHTFWLSHENQGGAGQRCQPVLDDSLPASGCNALGALDVSGGAPSY
eukprot:TRINITY_DN10299_c1_g1_i3.p1 TRINITY_DN10299_c1_g1~~TRINITY_DN10299_c1_g1_i3.p1  ORF type:complete len:314 (+),score=69.59 TRINITY_DN10299_c1_g1_i3:146-1087(+)